MGRLDAQPDKPGQGPRPLGRELGDLDSVLAGWWAPRLVLAALVHTRARAELPPDGRTRANADHSTPHARLRRVIQVPWSRGQCRTGRDFRLFSRTTNSSARSLTCSASVPSAPE